ncbi:Interleukin-13 [Microtus ochrogaster]|uniref:Interleukin-13 n=1 Tax=Microtus ochrogaster TaxID=79684 RepID=A0A8J6KUU5_MICOH|nr:Interleukin-13 [Microtus ochrogaster]
MALWLTAVLALACLGGLAAPGPVQRPLAPSDVPLRELIEELINITQDQRAPLCNGSMVWSVDLRAGGFCAALDSLTNISSCKPIYKTQRILNGLCTRKASVGCHREWKVIPSRSDCRRNARPQFCPAWAVVWSEVTQAPKLNIADLVISALSTAVDQCVGAAQFFLKPSRGNSQAVPYWIGHLDP